MSRSIHSDERGISHVLLGLVVVLVIAAVAFAGWRVAHKDDTSSGNGSTLSNCMNLYKDQTLCNFAAANARLGKLSYTAVDTSTDNMGQTTKITIKNDGKGSLSIFSQNGNQSYNTITIGNTVYVQNGGGWIQYTSKAPSVSNPVTGFKADFSTTGTPKDQRVQYKKLGQEKCGSGTCIKYQVVNPTWAGTNYIWIDTGTSQMQRWYNKNGNGVNDLTISYGPVTITAPSPVTPASNALDAQTQAEIQAAQQQAQSAAGQ